MYTSLAVWYQEVEAEAEEDGANREEKEKVEDLGFRAPPMGR